MMIINCMFFLMRFFRLSNAFSFKIQINTKVASPDFLCTFRRLMWAATATQPHHSALDMIVNEESVYELAPSTDV